MRYVENKDQSAEILRLILPLMARQEAAFHPLSYALWYEHVAGVNPQLTKALDEKLAANAALTELDVQHLYARYIAGRDVETFERLQHQLRVLLEATARNAASAGAEAASFGRALEGQSQRLNKTVDGAAIRRIGSELLVDTQRMRAVTGELSDTLVARVREVSELRERLERAQSEALLDPLTGLKNRRGLETAVDELAARGTGLAGTALLIADIDHFKAVNDAHGHVLGDKVIRAVAQVLRSNVKGGDSAVRLGGEEFAVLLPDTPLARAASLAEKIRALVAQGRIRRNDRDEDVGQVTLSLGVAAAGEGETLETLIGRADEALYAAKRAGRNCVCLADSCRSAQRREA